MSGAVLRHTVSGAEAGRTVESLLAGEFRLSRWLLQSLKWRPGAILRNGGPARGKDRVLAGDELAVFLAERPPSEHLRPCALPLEIVYEDGALLVLNKPASVPMHDKSAPSLAGALLRYLGEGAPVHLVNRLDKGTSGLCVAAKNGYIHDRLRASLHTAALYRAYRAFALGRVEPPRGTVALPIGPAEDAFYRRAVRPDGQPASTDYRVLAASASLSYLFLEPRTGRTHQLRVHMSALGHPLAGDALYGGDAGLPIARPALHSCLLRFTHPLTGRPMEFTAPLPADMAGLLELL